MNNKITCKKLKTFPSTEWGPNGGYCADIYFEGVKQGYFHQAGEGGVYMFHPAFKNSTQPVKSNEELNKYCKEYFSNNKFARLFACMSQEAVKKYCDLETMVDHYLCMDNVKKAINKMLKKGTYDKYVIVLKEPTELFDSDNVVSFCTKKSIPEYQINMFGRRYAMEKGWKDTDKIYVFAFESVDDLLKLI